jgi:hypothetical protein
LVYRAFSKFGGLRLTPANVIDTTMRWAALALVLAVGSAAAQAQPRAPLYDAIALNIGINCQWQPRCMTGQQRAMKRALKYVKKYQPATWRVELCNHNAGRKSYRVDWVGFDNCIRNTNLRPLPPRAMKRRGRKIA